MKQGNVNPPPDSIWSWPEKTWFRDRLNYLKSRQFDTHRRALARPANSKVVDAKIMTENQPNQGSPDSNS